MQKAKQRAEREIEKARQEAQRIISRTRAQADAVAEELEKARKAKDMSVQARTQLKKNIDKMEAHADPVKARNTPDEEYKLPRPLKVGDTVLIYDIDKNATVLAPPNKDGVVLVQAGIIKTRVDIKNLRLLKSNNKPAKDRFSSTRNVPSRMDVRPETEVDVRGETAFDAINIVDKAIEQCRAFGCEQNDDACHSLCASSKTSLQILIRSVARSAMQCPTCVSCIAEWGQKKPDGVAARSLM